MWDGGGYWDAWSFWLFQDKRWIGFDREMAAYATIRNKTGNKYGS